jgi:hypothetical protein
VPQRARPLLIGLFALSAGALIPFSPAIDSGASSQVHGPTTTTGTSTAATALLAADVTKHFSVHAFDINADADDLIAAPGTAPGTPAPGDQSLVNDQLTTTKERKGSYAIIGFDSGTCTYTRTMPDGQSAGSPFNEAIEHCLATAQFAHGSITATGVIVSQGNGPPPRTDFTVLGGTGVYANASGTLTLTFGKDFNTYSFSLH